MRDRVRMVCHAKFEPPDFLQRLPQLPELGSTSAAVKPTPPRMYGSDSLTKQLRKVPR